MSQQVTPGAGHPAHQLRRFTVTARRGSERARTVRVTAQTERDAIFRAGLILAGQTAYPDPAEWYVTAIRDQAPRVWIPGEATR